MQTPAIPPTAPPAGEIPPTVTVPISATTEVETMAPVSKPMAPVPPLNIPPVWSPGMQEPSAPPLPPTPQRSPDDVWLALGYLMETQQDVNVEDFFEE